MAFSSSPVGMRVYSLVGTWNVSECELAASGEQGGRKRIEMKIFISAIQEKRRDFGSTYVE